MTQKVPYSLFVSSQYIFLLSSDQTSALIVLSANITDAPSYSFPLDFFSDQYFSFFVQSSNIFLFPKKYFLFFPPEYLPLFPKHIYFLIKIHLVNFNFCHKDLKEVHIWGAPSKLAKWRTLQYRMPGISQQAVLLHTNFIWITKQFQTTCLTSFPFDQIKDCTVCIFHHWIKQLYWTVTKAIPPSVGVITYQSSISVGRCRHLPKQIPFR